MSNPKGPLAACVARGFCQTPSADELRKSRIDAAVDFLSKLAIRGTDPNVTTATGTRPAVLRDLLSPEDWTHYMTTTTTDATSPAAPATPQPADPLEALNPLTPYQRMQVRVAVAAPPPCSTPGCK